MANKPIPHVKQYDDMAGADWDFDQEDDLAVMFEADVDIEYISKKMGRSVGSIRSRLYKMKLLDQYGLRI